MDDPTLTVDSPANLRAINIFADLPVQTHADLKLDAAGFAETLAQMAWNPQNRTPFVAAVQGDWGRGKTTVLEAARRLLDGRPAHTQYRKVRTLWFNAWKYPSEETVLAGLLGELLRAMEQDKRLTQSKLFLRKHWTSLAKEVITVAAPKIAMDLFALPYAKVVSASISRLLTPSPRFTAAEKSRAFYDLFRPLFAELWYLWGGSGTNALEDLENRDLEKALTERQDKCVLAIFLDDLDRCPAARVQQTLEAINLFLDLPGVCFFLGVDWQRLRATLAQSKTLDETSAEEYLEKIVQISFDLPVVNEAGVSEYAWTLVEPTALAERGTLVQSDLATLSTVVSSPNPRHVKAWLNNFSFALGMLGNAGGLGEEAGQVPERAVLAWHLIREALEPSLRAEIGSSVMLLKSRLEQWTTSSEPESETTQPDPLRDRVDPKKRMALSAHAAQLLDLDDPQLNRLIHTGSAVREPSQARDDRAPRGPRQRTKSAIAHSDSLLDLRGRAWVSFDGGAARIGDEQIEHASPRHTVELSPFQIARYPVTNEQYRDFVSAADHPWPRYWLDGEIPEGKERHPVVEVSWTDAQAFSEWLQLNTRGAKDVRIRLPTEREWEFVASGSNGERTYPWGDEAPSERRAHFGGDDTVPVDVHPAGATPEGVHDLAGNVWEWCQDWYGPYPENVARDYSGPEDGKSRVLRGGSFRNHADALRVAFRINFRPDVRYSGFGFRVVWLSPGGL